ncbi:MAG: roadblock/LC7 domain-containing protein [Snowella sp.]|nr:roadblock/LC7 domain-containing protein [Snowella sp.]
MSLLVSQLVYTNLPKTGFQLLVSQQIPIEVKEAFVKEIVYESWDAYNPPSSDYQAVYIHQVSSKYTLFGWLYNDGKDELGRSHVPYFLSYFFLGKLTESLLQQLFQYLESGPIDFIERSQLLGHQLEQFFLPDIDTYESPKPSFYITSEIKQKASQTLKTGKRIRLLASSDQELSANAITLTTDPATDVTEEAEPNEIPKIKAITDVPYSEITDTSFRPQTSLFFQSPDSSLSSSKNLDIEQIEQVFQDVIQEGLGIQGAILVSEEGRPLTQAIGIAEEQALILAAKMLSLAHNLQSEMKWNGMDAIAIHSSEGHLMLTPCLSNNFIFIQASQILTGLLEVEIKRIIRKIEAICQNNDIFVPFAPLWNDLEAQEDIEGLMSRAEEEILYRGRRISL